MSHTERISSFNRDRSAKRHALQLAIQLPLDPRDARQVLRELEKLLDLYLDDGEPTGPRRLRVVP